MIKAKFPFQFSFKWSLLPIESIFSSFILKFHQQRNWLLIIILFPPFFAFSQNLSDKQLHQKDSLHEKLIADSARIFRFQKVRPFLNIDQRNSFIRDAPINIYGLQLGVILHERHGLGLGGYTITSTGKQKVKTKINKDLDVTRVLDMKYITLFYQYTVVDKRFFEIDLQAEFGGGVFHTKLYDTKTWKLLFDRSANLAVTGIGPQLTIKPLPWIGISGMAGYRFTFEKNANLNFNGLYYAYGLWFDVRQTIRDIRYYLIKKPAYKRHLHHILGKD